MTLDAKVDEIVHLLRKTKKIDRSGTERLFGTHLRPTATNDSFRTYRSDPLRIGGSTITLELRESGPGSGATSGPLFIIDVIDGCASFEHIKTGYGPWTLLDSPRGDTPNGRISWSHVEPWGRLAYVYREQTPKCLSGVSFNVREP